MEAGSLLYPLFAMVGLTLGAAMVLFARRIRAVQKGLNPGYFRHNRGAKLPDPLIEAEQHYQNLFELPVLYYAGLLLALHLGLGGWGLLLPAWAFVLSRVAHTTIHLWFNQFGGLRRDTFLLSYFSLCGVWLGLLLAL